MGMNVFEDGLLVLEVGDSCMSTVGDLRAIIDLCKAGSRSAWNVDGICAQ